MFENNGYLAPGMHVHTAESLKSCFVELEVLAHPKRALIFSGYTAMISLLHSVGVFPEQWFGGSFVTTKREPNDIDLISICQSGQVDRVPVDLQDEFAAWFLGEQTRAKNLCDSYLVVMGMEEHPKSKQFKTIYDYWKNQFGHDETGTPKGIVTTTVSPPVVGIER